MSRVDRTSRGSVKFLHSKNRRYMNVYHAFLELPRESICIPQLMILVKQEEVITPAADLAAKSWNSLKNTATGEIQYGINIINKIYWRRILIGAPFCEVPAVLGMMSS